MVQLAYVRELNFDGSPTPETTYTEHLVSLGGYSLPHLPPPFIVSAGMVAKETGNSKEKRLEDSHLPSATMKVGMRRKADVRRGLKS